MTQQAYTGHTGPYIVTTKRPCTTTADSCHGDPEIEACICGGRVSRRAVATLMNARTEVTRIALVDHEALIAASYDDLRMQFDGIGEAGGSVGPLPDGTVIEVEPRQWYQLAQDVGWDFYRDAHRDEAELLAAYNAAQAEGLMP